MCVVGGWFKQPHLAQRVWGWVRLNTCGALANQRQHDKPDITTHTHSESTSMCHLLCFHSFHKINNKPDYSTACVLGLEEPL